MTEYNIALLLDDGTAKEIIEYYSSVREGFNVEYGLDVSSRPHITVLKVESDEEIDISGISFEGGVTLSGVTLLPSRQNGLWVEIAVLKSKALAELQENLLELVGGCEIKSGTGDRFRPHITLCRTKDTNCSIEKLGPDLLRRKDVPVRLALRKSEGIFEIQ